MLIFRLNIHSPDIHFNNSVRNKEINNIKIALISILNFYPVSIQMIFTDVFFMHIFIDYFIHIHIQCAFLIFIYIYS